MDRYDAPGEMRYKEPVIGCRERHETPMSLESRQACAVLSTRPALQLDHENKSVISKQHPDGIDERLKTGGLWFRRIPKQRRDGSSGVLMVE